MYIRSSTLHCSITRYMSFVLLHACVFLLHACAFLLHACVFLLHACAFLLHARVAIYTRVHAWTEYTRVFASDVLVLHARDTRETFKL